MTIIDFCNNNVGFMSILLTTGLLLCAFAQYLSMYFQQKRDLQKLRIKHIQELKNQWEELFIKIDYAYSYKAAFHIPKDYEELLKKLEYFLDDHLEFTRCYFSKDTYELEKVFVNGFLSILPDSKYANTTYNLPQAEFDNIYQTYQELKTYLFNETYNIHTSKNFMKICKK